MAKWYYKMAGQEIGPFTAQQLKQLAEERRIAPTDPVRRDTDTEWSIARNVKGLFPEKNTIPTGIVVPVQPVSEDGEEPIPVVVPTGKLPKGSIPTAVAVSSADTKAVSVKKGASVRPAADIPAPPMAPPPPKAVPAAKRAKARPAAEAETFDFGFDSAVHSAPAGGKRTAPARKAAVKTGGKAQTNAAQNGDEDDSAEEKRPLTKKEIQKRNFLICLIATGAVIVLAVLILLIVSCGKSGKPKNGDLNDPAVSAVENADGETADQESAVGEDGEDAENADGDVDSEGASGEGTKKSEDGKDANGEDSEDGAKNALPEEWAEIGYKSPLVDGKPMSCTFGSLKVFIKKIEIASLEERNPNTKMKSKDRKYCFVKIEVENVNADGKLLDVPGWGAKGTPLVQLFDEKENQYKTQRIQVPDQADSSMQIGQGESFTDILAFNPPKLEKVEFLRLILPPVQKGESECLLYLPKEFFAPEKNADDAAAEAADGMEENADGETVGGDAAEDGEAAENGDGAEDAENVKDPENGSKDDSSENAEADGPVREPSALDDPSLGGADDGSVSLEELGKTPPPVEEESKELEEASFDALNDPSLN